MKPVSWTGLTLKNAVRELRLKTLRRVADGGMRGLKSISKTGSDIAESDLRRYECEGLFFT